MLRTRTPVKVVVGVVVLAVAVFGAVYFLFFTPDSPDPLRLSETPGAQPTEDVAGVWRVAPGSEARYRAREKLANLPAQSDAVGTTPAVTGQVRIEESGNAIVAHEARFEADLTKLTSDQERRDGRIRTQGLESDKFPTATFAAAEPIRLSEQAATARPVKVSAVGDLTLHGVTKRVTIPIDAQMVNGQIELVGSLRFPLSDFGITPPSVSGFVTVEPDVTMEFRLLLQKG